MAERVATATIDYNERSPSILILDLEACSTSRCAVTAPSRRRAQPQTMLARMVRQFLEVLRSCLGDACSARYASRLVWRMKMNSSRREGVPQPYLIFGGASELREVEIRARQAFERTGRHDT